MWKEHGMVDRVGQQLGHYRLVRYLGHGGFAEVYVGEHIHLGTEAAIKVLGTRLEQHEIEQFRNEARIIARLDHPHIVRVLDFDVEQQVPFLVMSYAPNGTMRQRYPRGSCMPLNTLLFYVKQIAAALQYAHDQRLIHRDVKPENILLGRNHEALLSDFGLAVVSQSSSHEAGKPRDMAGTILYMAPEQTRGKPRPASDQYALGIVVYEWLCGKRPFDGTYEEIAVQHSLAPPPSLCAQMPEIPASLEAVVMRALAKDPHERFPGIKDFAEALEQVCVEEKVTLIPPPFENAAYKTATGSREHTYSTDRTPSDTVLAVAWSPDRHYIVSGGYERAVQVWQATTGVRTAVYRGHAGRITAVAWSPDGKRVASASLDKTIQVWQVASGKMLASYHAHTGMVYAVAWSPDGRLLASISSGSDYAVHIWDATSGQHVYSYRGHAYWPRALAWSPCGRYLASGSLREVHIWEFPSGRKISHIRGFDGWVRTLAWSPDSKYIASAGEDRIVHVWEAHRGRDVYAYHGHNEWIGSLAWSPNGKRIASISKECQVHAWDALSGGNLMIKRGSTISAYAIGWLPDSKHLVFTNGEASVQVWELA